MKSGNKFPGLKNMEHFSLIKVPITRCGSLQSNLFPE